MEDGPDILLSVLISLLSFVSLCFIEDDSFVSCFMGEEAFILFSAFYFPLN